MFLQSQVTTCSQYWDTLTGRRTRLKLFFESNEKMDKKKSVLKTHGIFWMTNLHI